LAVKIFNIDEIKQALEKVNTIEAIEKGFVAYSQGKVVVPPVGEMLFSDPSGEVHIKYGYIRGEIYSVIKIASGFYENIKLGLPTGDGLMLLFSQMTGQLEGILLDEGYLTNVRTAAAGAVAAKYLAPNIIRRIGIFGAGVQGRLQLIYLKTITSCRDVMVWGINQKELDIYKKDMEKQGFNIQATMDAEDIASKCNLIVTATPSKSPLLHTSQIRPGTHITAMGSDTPEKNELDPGILEKADIIAVDSLSQSRSRGEIFQASRSGRLDQNKIFELGNVIQQPEFHRQSEEQISVADLTGVAVQDIQISVAVFEILAKKQSRIKK
jgi:ornithine cyclodeaminase